MSSGWSKFCNGGLKDFNLFITDPHFNPSKHIKPSREETKPYQKLEEGKIYEIEIQGEGKGIFEFRGFWFHERDYTTNVILWPKGASSAEEYLSYEILSVKEVFHNQIIRDV